jgi:hypothetical protein
MKEKLELQKHTLNLREGDYEKIATYMPDVPTAIVIRRIISRFVDNLEASGGTLDSTVEIKL